MITASEDGCSLVERMFGVLVKSKPDWRWDDPELRLLESQINRLRGIVLFYTRFEAGRAGVKSALKRELGQLLEKVRMFDDRHADNPRLEHVERNGWGEKG